MAAATDTTEAMAITIRARRIRSHLVFRLLATLIIQLITQLMRRTRLIPLMPRWIMATIRRRLPGQIMPWVGLCSERWWAELLATTSTTKPGKAQPLARALDCCWAVRLNTPRRSKRQERCRFNHFLNRLLPRHRLRQRNQRRRLNRHLHLHHRTRLRREAAHPTPRIIGPRRQ